MARRTPTLHARTKVGRVCISWDTAVVRSYRFQAKDYAIVVVKHARTGRCRTHGRRPLWTSVLSVG
jgi:hypothetical protein